MEAPARHGHTGHEDRGHDHGHEEVEHDERPGYRKYLWWIIATLTILVALALWLVFSGSKQAKPDTDLAPKDSASAPAASGATGAPGTTTVPGAKVTPPAQDPLVAGTAAYKRAQIADAKAKANDGARVVVLNEKETEIVQSGTDTGTALETSVVYGELTRDAEKRIEANIETAELKARMKRLQSKEQAIKACGENTTCVEEVKDEFAKAAMRRFRATLNAESPVVPATAPSAPVAQAAKPKAARPSNASQQSSSASAASAGHVAKPLCHMVPPGFQQGAFLSIGQCP